MSFIVTDRGYRSVHLHIYAALAEKERRLISERTGVSLAAAKARGGFSLLPKQKNRWIMRVILSECRNAQRKEGVYQNETAS